MSRDAEVGFVVVILVVVVTVVVGMILERLVVCEGGNLPLVIS